MKDLTMTFIFATILFLTVLMAVMFLMPDTEEDDFCDDDLPCQECGKCFEEHPQPLTRHSYVRPDFGG